MVTFHRYVSLPEGKTSRVGLQFDGLWEMYSDCSREGDAAMGCKQLSTGCLALIPPRPLTNWGLQAPSELLPT